MTTKKKLALRVVRRRGDIPTGKDFAISVRTLWWVGGSIAGLLAGIIAWNTVWDRIDNHWRLETTQKALDSKIEGDIRAAREKAETDNKATREKAETDNKVTKEKAELDTKRLAQRAEVGRAWLFWSILDFKADWKDQQLEQCRDQKKLNCARLEAAATLSRAEAGRAKDDAANASKER